MNAMLTIAYRDVLKFVRDRSRIAGAFLFPALFIGVLGGSFQANLGKNAGFNFLTFVFTGVLLQTMFQSTALGIISLLEDRETDFSQEIFISPVSRYTIILGKIVGESVVSLLQGIAVIGLGLVVGVRMTPVMLLGLVPVLLSACLLGGAFGVLMLSLFSSQRAANQLFPLIFFPQFFLAGVFSPIRQLPLPLDILSHLSPMRYAVDLGRGVFYATQPDYRLVVIDAPLFNLTVSAALFVVFLLAGTVLFVRAERNK
jgi:ABC-2 type transport system permease protein